MKTQSLLIIFANLLRLSSGQNVAVDVNLLFVTGDSIAESLNVSWPNAKDQLKPNFDGTKKSIIFAPGWGQKLTADSISGMIQGHHKGIEKFNVFILNWTAYSTMDYLRAYSNIPNISNYMAQNLLNLQKQGFDLDKFQLIGFSLGGQLVASISRAMQTLGNYFVSRITGLDPSVVLFRPQMLPFVLKSMNHNDARFVDIIQTSVVLSGNARTGHVNFYPNGGTFQPGCSFQLNQGCSHHRSWQYYNESLFHSKDDKKFQAVKCKNYASFKIGSCNRSPTYNYLGYHVNPDVTGSFYLRTNAQSPFSL